MTILNIAGYRFVNLDDLAPLQQHFLSVCNSLTLKGTILLSHEGINLSLAGKTQDVANFKTILSTDNRFAPINFHESFSSTIPFRKLKVKLKKEIITFKKEAGNPLAPTSRAPSIPPTVLKQWLDEKKDITLFDTRNEYEIAFGTFNNAINPHINHFTELAEKVTSLNQSKPVVIFCTGGIRCEKAAHYMKHAGFREVYQLDGGILRYFKEIGQTHWVGNCFVFDERVAVNAELAPIQTE